MKQQGSSLLSMLIGLSLLSAGLVGSYQTLTSLMTNYGQRQQALNNQWHGLLASEMLRQQLQQSCLINHHWPSNCINETDSKQIAFSPRYQLYHSGHTPKIWQIHKAGSGQQILTGDAIVIRGCSHSTIFYQKPLTVGQTSITLTKSLRLKKSLPLLVMDATTAILLPIKSINKRTKDQKIMLNKPIIHDFPHGALIRQMTTHIFYIGKTTRTTPKGKTIHSLYTQTPNNKRLELIDHIDQLTLNIEKGRHHNILLWHWVLANGKTQTDSAQL